VSSHPRLSLAGLKEFALTLPERSPLRAVLLGERDTLTPEEFLAKSEVWTVLLSWKEE